MENRNRQAGFTLIELLVVIALLSVFAIIAVPSYRALTADNQMIGALNDFANTLGSARAAAVARGQTVVVCPSSNALSTDSANPPSCDSQSADPQQWNTGWISFVDANGNGKLDAGETVLRVHGPLASGITLTSPGGGGSVANYIGFNRMGFATPTFSGKTELLVQACGSTTAHSRGGSVKLLLAGSLSTSSGGCP